MLGGLLYSRNPACLTTSSVFLSGSASGRYVLSRLYFRLRRTIGLQQFSRKWLIFYIVIYVLASLGLAALSGGRPKVMLGWIGGLVPGILLGLWGLRLTKHEITEKGRCYTPSAHIGVALYLLFLGRLVYRVIRHLHQFVPGWPSAAGLGPKRADRFHLRTARGILYRV